jgi:hypothetical protein
MPALNSTYKNWNIVKYQSVFLTVIYQICNTVKYKLNTILQYVKHIYFSVWQLAADKSFYHLL